MNQPYTSRVDAERVHPVLAVTMGDMNGIGPEVILKVLSGMLQYKLNYGILLFASDQVMCHYAELSNISVCWESHIMGKGAESEFLRNRFIEKNLNFSAPDTHISIDESREIMSRMSMPIPGPGQVLLVNVGDPNEKIRPGMVSSEAGKLAMHAVFTAVAACVAGMADAMITAPISKKAIHEAGHRVPGHTEYLSQLTSTNDVGMMLVNDTMRIGLATIHLPLRDVSGALTSLLIKKKIMLYHRELIKRFGITQPKIAVLGLNPHAGDGGILGSEEIEMIEPAIRELKQQGLDIEGPWPADGFFGNQNHLKVDLVFAMYHDQGLIPLKYSGFENGVNITIGLPFVRTSPDHGTAFAIAGANRADPGSMRSATQLALTMVQNQTKLGETRNM
ncbi:MAG: 4-hydroxythreonine-4-phosphate dehydrogenase PdxA [Balneolales bacterium]